MLIEVTDGATNVFDDSSQGPFDGGDDTLIGIVNDSSGTLGGIGLSANSDIFGFDGDGICSSQYFPWSGSANCPYGTAGYEGPGTTLSAATTNSGIVRFTGGLAPGASRYFSLEESLAATQVTGSAGPIGGPVSAAEGEVPNLAQLCACGVSGSHTPNPVTTPWGNFTHTFTDLSIPGRGPALQFDRTYSSYPNATVPDGPLGFGWSDPYGMNISLSGTSPNRVATVTQEDGAQVTFNESGASVWVPTAPRTIATLVFNSGVGTYTFTRQATQVLTFDAASGHLNSMADLNGNTLSLSYNGSGQVSTVTDAASRTLTLAYFSSGNGAGHIQSVTDGIGRSVTFTYDGSGNMATATEPNGGTWSFSYDGNHRMLTMLDPNQFGSSSPIPVTNHYDSQGRVDWQSDALSRKTTFDYSNLVDDPTGLVGTLVITDPKLNATQEQYSHGEKVALSAGYGTSSQSTTTYAYDPATLLPTSVIDPNLNTTLYSYDAQGNQTSMIDPLGRMTTSTYNILNEPLSIADPIGNASGGNPANHTTKYTYDANGNLTSQSRPCLLPDGATSCGTQTTTFNHGDPTHPGDLTSVVDPDNQPWSYIYDSAGDQTSVTDPLANQTLSCFDAVGRRTAVIGASAVAAGYTCATSPPIVHTTYFTYDAADGLLTSKDSGLTPTTYTYDADHNLKTVRDPDTNLTQYGYDAAGELATVTRADATVLRDDYYLDGSLDHQYDANNNATTYAYDPLGRVSSVADTLNRITSYTYDPASNRLTEQSPGGSCGVTPKIGCTSYGYDNANELTSINYSDGSTPSVSSINYDDAGERTAMTDGTGKSTWSYDSLYRITSTTDGSGNTVGYGYDLKGQLTGITYPGSAGAVARSYDDAGRLQTVSDWLSHQTTFSYDADSALNSEVYPNSTSARYNPDGSDRLMGISDATTANPNTPFVAFTYQRDNASQITSVTPTGVGQSNETYGYTALNQLKSVNGSNYAFDASDNLTATPAGTKLAYDAANQLCWTAPTTAACGGTTPSGATTYGYDGMGERTAMTPPTGNPAVTDAYDQAHRLSSVSGAGYRTAVLASNPTGYWRLGEATGTTAADSSGLANGGTYSGVHTQDTTIAVTTDPTNKSTTFDGASGYVNAGDLSAGESTTFSAEAWIRTTTTSPHYFLGEGSTSTDTPFDGLHVDSTGHAQFSVRDNLGTTVVVAGTKIIKDNVWHHIVGVRNGNTYSLYVDGETDGTATATLSTITLNTTSIGSLRRTSNSLFFAGSVDEAAYYPIALSHARVMNHYRAATSNYAGTATANSPLAYWRLGETSGTSAADSSANAHTGTYTGGYTLNVADDALTGDSNPAVSFNGTSGYVNVSPDTSAGEANAASAEAWIKTTATTNQYVLSEGSTSTTTSFDGLHVSGGKALFTVSGSGGSLAATGATTVSDNQWHHVVGVRNTDSTGTTTVSIYVDGKLDGTNTSATAPGTVTLNTTTIGSLYRTTTHAFFFAGSVDEAAYYSTALDATTIARHFHNGTTASPIVANYAYNGDGLRTSKTVDGITTKYTWDTALGLPLLISDGTNQYIYGPKGPIERVNGTTPLYYLQDQQGSTRALTSQTGTVSATNTTDAYGNMTASTGTVQTPLRYDGEYRDSETGFIYLRNRYYDPATAAFLTRDPAESINRSAYSYVAGNPLNMTDPNGLIPTPGDIWNDTGGTVISGAGSVIKCVGADIYRAIGGSGCSDSSGGPAPSTGQVVHGAEAAGNTVVEHSNVGIFGCYVVCVQGTIGLGGVSDPRVGFGVAFGAGVSVPPPNNPPCEADQFFLQLGPFGGSVQRSKDPNAPYSSEYGPWKSSGSVGYGTKYGGGFVHWWSL